MKKLLAFLPFIALSSCMDIGAVMFFGGDGAYEFTNASLPTEYQVDESKIHRFEGYSDQDTIQALYVGDFAQIATDTIIVYLHGNGPSMDNFWTSIARLANMGGQHRYGVVMYDYRGYGQSTGRTVNEESMAADYASIIFWLEERGLSSDRMVVFANSLGSLPAGPAADGGSAIPIQKLVMEVPQSSADAIIQGATGLSLPSSMITEYNFDLAENMANYQGDLLWMHGELDAVAPFDNAAAAMRQHEGNYYAEAVYPDAGHGLRWDIGDDEWLSVIHDFILH
jgi:pimeloyl-ACP methyl ester carboxylesterase